MTSVLIAASAKLPVLDPLLMAYGGIERAAYEYSTRLHAMGFEVLPAFPADSQLPFEFDRSALWSEASLCGHDRRESLSLEKIAAGQTPYARHVVLTAKRLQPDVVLLAGPRLELLQLLDAEAPELLARTIVGLHNAPSYYGTEMLDLLRQRPQLRLVALTNKHCASFEDLAPRMTVVREGVAVDRLPFAPDAAEARNEESGDLVRNPHRKLVSQIDMIGPQKGQLLSVMMFHRAGLHEKGYDFLIGGDFGATGKSESGSGPLEERQAYYDATMNYVAENVLGQFVYHVGALNGGNVARAYRCSDFVFAPHRMNHREIWPFEKQTAEAYGQAMGIAMASGSPILCSDQIDPSRMQVGVTGYRFSDLESGVETIGQIVDDVHQGIDRLAIRRFSEANDSVTNTVAGYAALIREISET